MAGSVNKVVLVGRLGQDPKLTYLPSGNAVCEMSVATDEGYKDRDGNKVDRVEWHKVKAFGYTAEFCGKYLSKGRLIYVEGTLKTRSWEKDGEKRYVTEVAVSAPGHTVQALDRGQDRGDQPQERQPAQAGRGRQYQPQPGEQDGPAFPSEASGMDDVPFLVILAPLAALVLAAICGGWVA
jgi:single-strand DNA-binding protein